MSLPAGRTIGLSPLRRVICDLMYFSRQVPLVSMERRLLLGDLLAARRRLEHRPSWFALFLKGYALVAQRREELRRSYLPYPWPRIHQHACNVAQLAIARRVGSEDAVLPLQVRHPERQGLMEIDRYIRRARTEPIEQFGDFRRMLLLGRLPLPLRRLVWWSGLHVWGHWRARFGGTFGITGVGAFGANQLHVLSPLTTTLVIGAFADDGSVPVRLVYDHRILDGVLPAQALRDLEETLRGPILDELGAEQRRAA